MTKHLHEKLGITFQELGALYGVRAMLANGTLKLHHDGHEGGEHLFNMNDPCSLGSHCGSVGCIGGNMALIMGMDQKAAETYVVKDSVDKPMLRDLFFPPVNLHREWDDITPEEAVLAINNFLENGDPRWAEVLGEDG